MRVPIVLLIIFPRYVFGIVNIIIGIQQPCTSMVDCLSSNNSNTVCYQGYCGSCRNSSQSCSSSTHCCGASRCLRHRCTALYKTGQACRLSRQCLNINDFCINRTCIRCIPLWSTCSTEPLATPCCVGDAVCRSGICQPASTNSQVCLTTFDCANELVCLAGTCQNPLGYC
ncbi:unnamed protein product [Rotaria socialis]|uniref:Uncharacterized protein n=1 Tax=Rotaria socialis TaxID=392032 RepID=A0A820U493_9BILA|nr:unnamed protein product [Rotaria socialis]CAF3377916.1 unnamed protein product [Rotaria socialis]CAF3668104.1 unnamed protein product [Rotaria socialis]CAF3688333.1 unnamed protein product [Rotaria socialis]CAF3758703.1 unnamed protein product [Rotaria socialis]